MGLTSGFGQSMQVLLPLLAKCSFGTDANGYGLLVAAMAIGAILGAVCFTNRVRSPRTSVLVGAALAFGALEMLAALSPSYWLCFAVLIATGVALLITNVSASSAVQLQVDPEFRGRTMALFVVVLLTSNSLGALLMGSLAQALSAPAALVIGGGAVLTTVPVAALLLSDRSDSAGR